MKTSTGRGLRTAVAASGVAMLMFVAGCGGSDDAGDGEADEQSASAEAEADANGEEAGAEDDSAAEEPAEDDSAAEEPAEDGADEGAEDDGGSDPAASGVVAPGDDFDPCTTITAEDINGVLGSELEEGSAGDMGGVAMCTFSNMETGESVIVQWAATPGSLDDALEAMSSMYTELGDPEQVTVAGTQEAAVVSGEIQGFPATILVGTADGGFIQVVTTAEDMSNDQAVQIAETTLAGV